MLLKGRGGIAAEARTGSYLYVMFDGPNLTPFDSATATAADVTGPDKRLIAKRRGDRNQAGSRCS